MSKHRLTVTIDEALFDEVSAAVDQGRAGSVSSWVNEAMATRLDSDRKLAILGDLIADYETEFGEITEEEMAQQAQQDRDAAALLRRSLHNT